MDDDRTAKARLRDAAVELVADGGTKALSARAVADRAELSQGLIRHHFGSMAALLRECGVRLLFVGDRHDAVVTARDAALPSAHAASPKEVVIVEARLPAGADRIARTFGHGPVVADPATLEAIARLVGRQECLEPGVHAAEDPSTVEPAAEATDATVEAELERLKREMGR